MSGSTARWAVPLWVVVLLLLLATGGSCGGAEGASLSGASLHPSMSYNPSFPAAAAHARDSSLEVPECGPSPTPWSNETHAGSGPSDTDLVAQPLRSLDEKYVARVTSVTHGEWSHRMFACLQAPFLYTCPPRRLRAARL